MEENTKKQPNLKLRSVAQQAYKRYLKNNSFEKKIERKILKTVKNPKII